MKKEIKNYVEQIYSFNIESIIMERDPHEGDLEVEFPKV